MPKYQEEEPILDPYLDHLITEDGREYKKVYVMYKDGDKKLCDCCDEKKSGVASIVMLCGDIACLCRECVRDILSIWD